MLNINGIENLASSVNLINEMIFRYVDIYYYFCPSLSY